MPKVPPGSSLTRLGSPHGPSPLSQITPENLLMSAATMQEQGRFSIPNPQNELPDPTRKKKIRKLKVVK